MPQLVGEGALHTLPAQQPAAQVLRLQPLQAPPVQVSPAGQAAQATPPAPHAVATSPGWQVVPEQQPDGQETPSQMHWVPSQRCPGEHSGPVPQRHFPLAEQALAVAGLQATHAAPPEPQDAAVAVKHWPPRQQPSGQEAASQRHRPFAQRCPAGQAGPWPHWQTP